MENYFDSEFKNIEREIVQLKTAAQRSSAVVSTVKKSITVAIPLALNAAQTACSGTVRYRITTADPELLSMTLAKYYDDVNVGWTVPRETRVILLEKSIMGGDVIVSINGWGTQGSGSDTETLIGGGSVTLNNTLTVIGTDDFNIERIN